ncbi:MAG: DUF1553 domain-containing protein [Chthonomonadales bacterium]
MNWRKQVRLLGSGLAALLLSTLVLPTPVAHSQQPKSGLDWWAFQSPVKAPPPNVLGATNPIDTFLRAKLATKGLKFAPPADRVTIIRRATFDLTGLPPTPEQLNSTYEKTLTDLLASPHYGERWGRYWLDVVRYGETDGGEHNYERPNAWPYRDYVIDALNRDLPYNQFVREQIAGDILFPKDYSKVAATGFLVSGPWDQVSAVLNKDPIMRMTSRMDELDDMVTTTSATFLGLTVNCARCHDHKFDPIPAKDYYRMAAAFSGAGFGEKSIATAEERARYDKETSPIRSEISKETSALAVIEDKVATGLLVTKYEKFDASRRNSPQRIPVNQLYNRESFARTEARYWRMLITDQHKIDPRIDYLKLNPVGYVHPQWKSAKSGSTDKPAILEIDLGAAKPVSEIIWSSDRSTGKKEGTPSLYRFEASVDGVKWRTVASNLDHVSRIELDLPELSDEDFNAVLTEKDRLGRLLPKLRVIELQKKLDAIPTPRKMYAVNPHNPEQVSLLKRGSVATPIELVTPGGLTCVRQMSPDISENATPTEGERRLALADWIVNPKNPLTARVIVNRVWYYHFGAGIVNTPSDFGVNGDRPSHPELLDWLAVAFIEHGWSLKWLHRQIMTSQAYQQSSLMNPEAAKVDAGNRLLWRMPLKRMDAETLRDSILMVTGNLDFKAGGPGFALHQNSGRGSFIYHVLENDGPAVWRRSVYRFVVRGGDKVLLDSFDCPDPSVATPQRSNSNTPVQALALMNNQFVIRQADLFAKRLQREAPNSIPDQISRAYLLAFGRLPKPDELQSALKFVKSQSLSLYCRALLNANEFIYTP